MRRGSTIFEGRRPLGLLPFLAWLLAIAPASAQQRPAPPATTAPPAAAPAAPAQDLTVKYRFSERYAAAHEPAPPGALGGYRVAVEDSRVTTTDPPGANPLRVEQKYQAVFNEQAAAIDSLNDRIVTDVVRRYEKVRNTDSRMPADYKPPSPPYLDGLTLWIKNGLPKQIFCLTDGRRIRIEEFGLAQAQVFIPGLTYTLPDIDCRIGDEWPITTTGTIVLLADAPPESGGLRGKLLEIRSDPNGPTKTAIFKVSGNLKSGMTESAVNAQINFEFTPTPIASEASKRASDVVIEARGGISRIVLGETTTAPIPSDDPKERSRVVISREYRFQRKFQVAGPPLDIPVSAPQPTEANSWLTFNNPEVPFQFRFPQDMRQDRDEASYSLSRGNEQEGLEQIRFTPLAKSDPMSNPDAMRKTAIADLEAQGWEVTPGTAAYLPDTDWPKLRVFRWDAVVRPKKDDAAKSQRPALFIGYSIVSSRDQALYVEATSTHEPLLPIKAEVESILHTLTFDPPKK